MSDIEDDSPVIEPAEVLKPHLTSEYFYDDSKIFKESRARTAFDDNYEIFNIYGFDLSRRYNAQPLNETTLVLTAGNYAYFLDLVTGSEQIIVGHNSGIYCCAVHPNTEYVVLGESGKDPKLLVYHFPSSKLYRVLKSGTESSYTAVNFSPDGTMLAAVGTYPDYMLTVWDWEKENLILRAKAFSQDIYRVTFSENLAGRLVSSGVGHIRVWEMAKTFTGLKLQGEIGKFGNIEISDTSGYAMFPDGKVLSGSESGSLLLWEDALVKCEFVRAGGKRCHKGMIEVVFHKGHDVITAGRDGVIRIWDYSAIDTAETEDTSTAIDLTMKGKLRISKTASIKCMYTIGSSYLVVDANEGLYRADLDTKKVQMIQSFHSGAIRSLAFSPNQPIFLSGGDDGTVRLWDISDKRMIGELHFDSAVTKILWPKDDGMDSITAFVGFADGCLRVILISSKGITLKQPLKPHTAAVRDIMQSPTSKLIATTGDDGALFFLRFDKVLTPLGFVYINGKKPKTKEEITEEAISGKSKSDMKEYSKGLRIRWSNVVSVECSDGTISSVQTPSSFPSENSDSFYIDIPVETLPGNSPDENVTAVLTREEGSVFGLKDGTIRFRQFERKLHSSSITSVAISPDSIWLCTGSENGELFLFKQTTTRIRGLPNAQLKEITVAPVSDIKGSDYSIEEEKQKSELDRRIRAAEEKKTIKRQKIESLRQKFSAVVQQNSKAPFYMQLDQSQFKLDPFLFDLMAENASNLEKEASKQTMFVAEKSRVALRKVKQRLIRNVVEESFSVISIDGNKEVTSFRLTELDPQISEILRKTTTSTSDDDDEVDDIKSQSTNQADSETVSSISSTTTDNKKSRNGRFGRQAPLKKVAHTSDEHTIKRQKRDSRRRAIMELKPPANYSDPDDLKAIEIAKSTIGDYKLKDDPSYIAPEEERMNASKKRRQLMMLLSAIQDLKITFNKRLKDLSSLRSKLIESIDQTNRELIEIRGTIGYDPLNDELIHVTESKKKSMDISEKIELQVPTPESVVFAEQVAAAARRRLEAQAGKQKQAAAPAHRPNAKRKHPAIAKKKKAEEKPKLSEVEQIEMNAVSTELHFRRKMLIKNIQSAIDKFNLMVEECHTEKVNVHTKVILAELRFILMLREFKLLAKLELKDGELNSKLKAKESEMKSIDNEVSLHNKQLKQQEHDVEEAEKELKKMRKKFDSIVETTSKYHDPLLRIFNFNIRRNQDKMKQDEEEVDLTALDVEQVKKMFEKQNVEKEEDSCPQGCDIAVFDKVLDLREERMDILDKISQAKTIEDQILRQIESVSFKRKALENSYSQIKQEFEEFQHEKQRHLNELNFSLSLQFHQIKHLISKEVSQGDGRPPQIVKSMPTNLNESLIFTQSGLQKLIKQEQTLRADRGAASKILAADTKKFVEDKSTLEELKKELSEKQSKVADIQKLKFGENVDLVELEKMKVNKDADAVRAQIKDIEVTQTQEMESINEQIKEMTEYLTKEIQRNTSVLGRLVELTKEQREIESVLQNSRKTQTADDLNQDLELDNPEDLLQEVEKNNEIIDKLNEEITLLRRR